MEYSFVYIFFKSYNMIVFFTECRLRQFPLLIFTLLIAPGCGGLHYGTSGQRNKISKDEVSRTRAHRRLSVTVALFTIRCLIVQ